MSPSSTDKSSERQDAWESAPYRILGDMTLIVVKLADGEILKAEVC